jgi:hypothetical protein
MPKITTHGGPSNIDDIGGEPLSVGSSYTKSSKSTEEDGETENEENVLPAPTTVSPTGGEGEPESPTVHSADTSPSEEEETPRPTRRRR